MAHLQRNTESSRRKEFRCRLFPVLFSPNDWQTKAEVSSYFMPLESVLDQTGNKNMISMSSSFPLPQDSWAPLLVSKGGRFQVCIAVTARWWRWLSQVWMWMHCTWAGGFLYVSGNFSLADVGADLLFSLDGLSSACHLHPWDSRNLCVFWGCSVQPCAASVTE